MSNIGDLKFDKKNFNKHTEYGMGLLEKSLRENGAGRSILIDKDNNIIAGNGIVEAAGTVGIEKVKIVETTGDEIIAVKRTDIALESKEGYQMAMADNATAAADLEWDSGNIAEVADKFGLDPDDWGIKGWQDETTEVEEDEAPEVDEATPPKSELGKVYQLGNHRLMCGDSTDAGSVMILTEGKKADMVFTDPPYGIDYSGGRTQVVATKEYGKLKNDDLQGEDLGHLICNVFDCAKPDGDIYICVSPIMQKPFLDFIDEAGKTLDAVIVWDKKVPGLGYMAYRRQCEFILYVKGTPYKMGDKSDFDLWSIARDAATEYVHGTQKPVAVSARAIGNSSENGQMVLDLFGGSGSTLIACEQLGRKCCMMELDPKYCDVIRKRWYKLTHDNDETGWEEGTPEIEELN